MSVQGFPIAEMITRDVVSTLEQVQTSAGDNSTLTVERYKHTQEGNRPRDLLAVVCVGADAESADEDTPIGFKQWTRPYEIVVYVFDSDTSETPYDQRCDVVRADIERALMQDVTRGGYAANTEIRAPLLFSDPNDCAGVLIRVEVTYRTSDTDPYAATP